MFGAKGTLRLPRALRFVAVGAMTLGCSGGETTPQSDAAAGDSSAKDAMADVFDGGPCKIHVPAGKICVTTCWAESLKGGLMPEACQVYCDPKSHGCFLDGGSPDYLCDYTPYPDGGSQVIC